jgi:hypothetical protein
VPFPKYQRVTGEPYIPCERFMQMRGSCAGCVKAPFWKAQFERVMSLPRPRGEAAKNDHPNRRIFDYVPLFAFQMRRKWRGPMPDNRPRKAVPIIEDHVDDFDYWREAA